MRYFIGFLVVLVILLCLALLWRRERAKLLPETFQGGYTAAGVKVVAPEDLVNWGEKAEKKTENIAADGYDEYIKREALDPETMQSHKNFVESRASTEGALAVGRTFVPAFSQGELEGSNLVPFVGLFRPQKVEIKDPDQVAEFNADTYSDEPTLSWNTKQEKTVDD